MAKKFKVKTRDNLVDKCLEKCAKLVKKKPEFINLNDGEMPPVCIMIGNHNGAGGPFNYRTFMDKRFMTWGAHPMCEGFHRRRKYLYHIFYRQKLGYSKLKAFLLSIGFGIISKLAYNYAGIVPIYYDSRIFLTYKYSFQCFEKNMPVMIFPEDSEEGYKPVIDKFWPGFLYLSKLYYKKFGVDLPVYTLHYSKEPKKIVIGKPMYCAELLKEHSEDEVLKIFMDYMNSLDAVGKPAGK